MSLLLIFLTQHYDTRNIHNIAQSRCLNVANLIKPIGLNDQPGVNSTNVVKIGNFNDTNVVKAKNLNGLKNKSMIIIVTIVNINATNIVKT